ncbi:hypothetical protein RFI_16550 [Reticulomyxa filosa]|uniref:Uncharacterized protein n=1 Tax=Reticulomyxa filosa TaxID=46433 RepID=X6N3K9_RETFI|nr:hypothetical protein RFI_16550 [Reticulomyxa filosa]|eukprot:ETO20666.1 hypothetical protein RFI_16550 [Reticulomyxa filosa]
MQKKKKIFPLACVMLLLPNGFSTRYNDSGKHAERTRPQMQYHNGLLMPLGTNKDSSYLKDGLHDLKYTAHGDSVVGTTAISASPHPRRAFDELNPSHLSFVENAPRQRSSSISQSSDVLSTDSQDSSNSTQHSGLCVCVHVFLIKKNNNKQNKINLINFFVCLFVCLIDFFKTFKKKIKLKMMLATPLNIGTTMVVIG